MTVTGLELALEHSTSVEADELIVQVADISVVVLLKMIAFLDRPLERERDLEDIAHTVHQYAADDERRWDLEMISGRDWDEQSAWLLGLDISTIASSEHRELAIEFLNGVVDEQRAARMADLGPPTWRRDGAQAARRMHALVRGSPMGLNSPE